MRYAACLFRFSGPQPHRDAAGNQIPFLLEMTRLPWHPGQAMLLMQFVLRTVSAPVCEDTTGVVPPTLGESPLLSAVHWGDLLLTLPPWGKTQPRQMPGNSR